MLCWICLTRGECELWFSGLDEFWLVTIVNASAVAEAFLNSNPKEIGPTICSSTLEFLWLLLATGPVKLGQTPDQAHWLIPYRHLILWREGRCVMNPSYVVGFLPVDSLIGWPEVLNMLESESVHSPWSQATTCSFPRPVSHYLAYTALLLHPGPLPVCYPFATHLFLSVLLHTSLALMPGSGPTISVKSSCP